MKTSFLAYLFGGLPRLTDCRTLLAISVCSMSFRGEVRREMGDGVDVSGGFDSLFQRISDGQSTDAEFGDFDWRLFRKQNNKSI